MGSVISFLPFDLLRVDEDTTVHPSYRQELNKTLMFFLTISSCELEGRAACRILNKEVRNAGRPVPWPFFRSAFVQ